MTQYGDRDQRSSRTFASEDAMCRWLVAKEFRKLAPRHGAVVHDSAIAPIEGAGVWQVELPELSQLSSRANGMTVVSDMSGFFVDPEHGATQLTILEAATGVVLATWIPPHATLYTRFEGSNLVVDDLGGNASVCEPLTGRVIKLITSGYPEGFTEQLRSDYPNGWDDADGLTLVSTETSLAAYASRAT
jgi:hypothetical protein